MGWAGNWYGGEVLVRILGAFFSAVSLVCAGSGELAEPTIRFKADPEARIQLAGDSTLNQWDCISDKISGTIETKAGERELVAFLEYLSGETGEAYAFTANKPDVSPRVRLEVPIEMLDCKNRRMQRDLNSAVKAENFPKIKYRFLGMGKGVVERHLIEGKPFFHIPVRGEITLAGNEHEIAHILRIRRIGGETIEVSGKLDLKMTDFGIEPPSALFGLIRAHNEITVRYKFSATRISGED